MPVEPVLALAGAFNTFQTAAGCITTILPDFEPGAADVVAAIFGNRAAGNYPKKVFQVGSVQHMCNRCCNEAHLSSLP